MSPAVAEPTGRRGRRVRRVRAGLVTAMLLALPTVVQASPVRSGLVSIGVFPRPQEYLELAFTDPAAVGLDVSAAGRVSTRFTLASSLSRPGVVAWRADAVAGDGVTSRSLGEGRVALDPGGSVTVPVAGEIDCSRRTRITVTASAADRPDQEIHFWVRPETVAGKVACIAS